MPPEVSTTPGSGLEQLCLASANSLAILDRELRCCWLNRRLAEFVAVEPEQALGQTLGELLGPLGNELESCARSVIGSATAAIEVGFEAPPAAAGDAHRTLLVSFYPILSAAATVQSVGMVLQDLTEHTLRERALDERLGFETLLFDLSATLVNMKISAVDQTVEAALAKIVSFLKFDRSSLWQFDEEGYLCLTHSHALPGYHPPPRILNDLLPAWLKIVRRGELFSISDPSELPADHWREKEYCQRQGGIKSILFIPLCVGGTVLGVISFVSYKVKRVWPDEFVQRLRIMGELIASALARKEADRNIRKAFREIEQLKDRLEAENLYLRDQIELEHKHGAIVGQSESIRQVLKQVEQVADTDATVLIQGETGTGKELIAHALHALSGRRARTMIKVNCAALPATLIESELFGREKGAYTGAMTRQIGRFEAAEGSTIFLDEVGELPLELQAKLLRVLQEGQFERLGNTQTLAMNVRVIAATNRDLATAVQQGRFRQDLYYRLNVFPIVVPPLRDRRDDIPLLVWKMVRDLEHTLGKTIERIPKKVMEGLQRYAWPGNVRELRNLIERAMILSGGSSLHIDLPGRGENLQGVATTLAEVERGHLVSILKRTGWRVRGQAGAAAILGLKPTTLESRLKKLGIERPRESSEIP